MIPDIKRPDPVDLPASLKFEFSCRTARYGGGVSPGLPDKLTPFRIPAIRGHLRFWWRAVRGCDYTDAETLRKREGHVWGSPDGISPTTIKLAGKADAGGLIEALTTSRTFDGRTRYEPREPAYVLFPAQQRDAPGRISEKGCFFLEVLHGPKADPSEVEAALWAWTNFGGYGARTRRGTGSLYCPTFSFPGTQQPGVSAVRDWLQQQAGKYLSRPSRPGSKRQSRPWPALNGAEIILYPQALAPDKAWQTCIKIYRDFRQNRNPGNGNRPGRSRWPEPDQIRRERDTHHSLHRPVHPEGFFPRAIFGLPIVFHFKDSNDPRDQSLEPSVQSDAEHHSANNEGARMASPIIVKPLIVSPNMAFPMIVRLNCDLFVAGSESNRRISSLVLKQKEQADKAVHLGPRRADEEFLKQVERTWNSKRISL
jgi:CRISPR-associated protein Cmr1